MRKHQLWGRKNPGPWTTALFDGSDQLLSELTLDDENSYAEGFMNGIENVATAGTGSAYFVGSKTYNGGKRVVNSAVSGTQNFNEWSQGLSDPNTGVYPYTRDDNLTGDEEL